MSFSRSQLSHFQFLRINPFFTLNEEHFTFHLRYKHSGTFANRKYAGLSYPKKSKNVRPHSSNSIENATPLLLPWVPETYLARFPVSVKSL